MRCATQEELDELGVTDFTPRRGQILKATPGVRRKVDLRARMPPVYDQGTLGSCTANALCACVQYLDPSLQGSRLFLYYNERDMEGSVCEDSGASLTDGVRSLRTVGLCPEDTWPYAIQNFAVKPPQTCYDAAKLHELLNVHSVKTTVADMKAALDSGFPVVVGISIYASFESASVARTGVVSMPRKGEQLMGGHAVCVVGYDDETRMWIVRNSWGDGWGMAGYFTLPYAYLEDPKLSGDAWCLTLVEGEAAEPGRMP